MPPTPISQDPDGHYGRLGVAPGSGPGTITAAYRRKARLVHPDVPVTGDAAAFVELKQSYDILNHPKRREAYDRSARVADVRGRAGHAGAPGEQEPGEIQRKPFPEMTSPPTRHPRLRDLPVAVWIGMAVVLLVGAIEIGLHLNTSRVPVERETIPATAADVPPLPANQTVEAAYGPAPVRLAGSPNFYIVPTASPAMLWRNDDARHSLVPWSQLPPFSAVQGLRLVKTNGMVEVKVTDTANGFVEASRLTPGDPTAAARAWCTYHAGPTPRNGEVLWHGGLGRATLEIENLAGQPAVVKVRSPDGGLIASVFLGPGGETTIEGLPEEPSRLDFATGEVWSRACHGFEAGMRAMRLPDLVTFGALSKLSIPPDPKLGAVDLPDQAFEHE
jgi:hypothetical protein